ncbi:hypothetical protein AX774_g6647 [Zancudomyces culisetae]|uniref:Uncharacterized protein n=1 Tax=Zancudomyces culisetae TaxID=1213189 RepID=A0A1R1PG88_ZANCU|nr:hypothetical protein AX774_g6647 [Zancudomyces culisetae]|eukprot:OMH79933.1 hypothetical protein AX774_g6647 [Zancudomyces culisetae]
MDFLGPSERKIQEFNMSNANKRFNTVEFIEIEGEESENTSLDELDFASQWQQDDCGRYIREECDIDNIGSCAKELGIFYKKIPSTEDLNCLVPIGKKKQLTTDAYSVYCIILLFERSGWFVLNSKVVCDWKGEKAEWVEFSNLQMELHGDSTIGKSSAKNEEDDYWNRFDVDGGEDIVEVKEHNTDVVSGGAESYWDMFCQEDEVESFQGSRHYMNDEPLPQNDRFNPGTVNVPNTGNTEGNRDYTDKDINPLKRRGNELHSFDIDAERYGMFEKHKILLLNSAKRDLGNGRSGHVDTDGSCTFHIKQVLSSAAYFAKKFNIDKREFLELAENEYSRI